MAAELKFSNIPNNNRAGQPAHKNESDMAKIIENEKGFKVIEIDYLEMLKIGCGNICDHCGEPHYGKGYYVAVLNRWFARPVTKIGTYSPPITRPNTTPTGGLKQRILNISKCCWGYDGAN